jgi:hypothetical protein
VENKKRCPKCGEENPPEAVMCWACYTPLSAATAGAATTKRSKTTSVQTIDDEEHVKPATQPWQIAVIAIGLIFVLFWVGKNFLPSGSSGDQLPPASSPGTNPGGAAPPAPIEQSSTSTSGTSTISAVTPQKLPFTIAVAPNPNITVGTMAIVPTDSNISTGQAASLASFTRSQFTQMKRWNKLYIYVFRDQQSAKQFANYQRSRRGAPLTGSDYRNLTSLWGSALACYEYNNGSEQMFTPTNNPSGWWTG